MRRRRATTRGFTLIEAIIAVVVLAVALPPMLFAVREGQRQGVLPVKSAVARRLIEEKLEDILADRHSATRGYSYVTNTNYASESPVSGFTGYSRSVSITETNAALVATTNGGYKRCVVTVTCSDGANTQTHTGTVYVTQY